MNQKIEKGRQIQEKMLGIKHSSNVSDIRERFPKFQEWTLETLFGDVWARENELDLRTRSLCTVAALVVLNRPDQLRIHLKGALNNGATVEEISEVIMQMAFYGGWPCSVGAQKIAVEVFKEMGV